MNDNPDSGQSTEQLHAELQAAQAEIARLQAKLDGRSSESKPQAYQTVQTVLDIMSEAPTILSLPDRRVLYMSDAAAQIYGRSPADFIADPTLFRQVVHPNDLDRVDAALDKCLDDGVAKVETRIVLPDGRFRWLFSRLWLNHDAQGAPIQLANSSHDITERKQYEEALHQNESYLRTLIDSQTAFNVCTDLDGRITYYNRSYYDRFSLGLPSLIGRRGMETVAPDDHPIVFAAVKKCVAEPGQAVPLEIRKQTKDGDYIWTFWEFMAVRSDTTGTIELQCVGFDISKQKQAEATLKTLNAQLEQLVQQRTEALQASESQYRSVVEAMSEGVILVARGYIIQTCNAAAEQILGLTLAQMRSQASVDPAWHTVYEDGSPFPVERQPAAVTLTTGQPQSDVIVGVHKADGKFAWLTVNSRPVYHMPPHDSSDQLPDAVVVTLSDITARIEAERCLQQKLSEEQQLQKYMQTLHEMAIELAQIDTLDSFFRRVVEMGLSRLGFDRIALFTYDPGNNMASGTYGTDTEGQIQSEHSLRFVLRSQGGMWESLHTPNRYHLIEDGPLTHLRQVVGRGWNATVALRHGDRNIGWLCTDNLINHRPVDPLQLEILNQYGLFVAASLVRRQVEDALQKTRDQLQAILDHSTSGIFMKELNGRLIMLNRFAALDLGLATAPDTAAFYNAHDQQISLNGVPVSYEATVGARTFWITKFPIFDDLRRIYAIGAIATDISTRKLYENSLERALQKEKELGELKSRFVSIASHEFRTPLAAILGTTETLITYRDRLDNAQIDSRLERIRRQINHLTAILESVLDITRFETGYLNFNPTPGRLDALCQEIIEELRNQSDQPGRIRYQCYQPERVTAFDSRLMRQVLDNLLSNALKYSPESSAVVVTLDQQGDPLRLTVRDEGIGIPPGDLPHLFNPFHRATNVGAIAGTGLGLSITKQAVEVHGGSITVETVLAHGTTFTVTLPAKLDHGSVLNTK